MVSSIPQRLADRLRPVAAETLSSGPVNLSAVAEATGIPRSTLYYNFKGSEELTRWFIDELMGELGANVAAAAAAHVDPPAQLRAAVDATMQVAIQQPALTSALLRGMFAGPNFGDRLAMIRETVFPAIREVLERGIADGSFVEMDVDEAIAGFIGVIALVSLHHLGALGPAEPTLPENDFITAMLRGLINTQRSDKAKRATSTTTRAKAEPRSAAPGVLRRRGPEHADRVQALNAAES